MSKSKHLVKWQENEHLKKKGDRNSEHGCLWRHQSYRDEAYPPCNYRKNAHEHSKSTDEADKYYNIPNDRCSRQYVTYWSKFLKIAWTKGNKKEGRKARPIKGTKPKAPKDGAWDLGKDDNFQHWMIPYWHNTHHIIGCGAVRRTFEKDEEQKLLLASGWNINNKINAIILPKQIEVARILKLPAHVPPRTPPSHKKFCGDVESGLNKIKAKLAKNRGETNHELVDEDKGACKDQLERVSKRVRSFLFRAGEKDPGIDIDTLSLDSLNWAWTRGV